MSAAEWFFYGFGALAVGSALAMVANVRNAVAAALSLIVTMISLAGIYVLLEAHLIAALQVMIYAGAIVVLFLFVVMLLNLRQDRFPRSRRGAVRALALGLGVALAVGLVSLLPSALPESRPLPEGFGGYRVVGLALYRDFVLPFEASSFLLLAAIVGAVVLAKRRLDP